MKPRVSVVEDKIFLLIDGITIALAPSEARALGNELRSAALHVEKIQKSEGTYKRVTKRLRGKNRHERVTK
mgnify:CR=1 FL=1